MGISKQIGWSQESNLLYQILKQLNQLTSVIFGLKPKYKVYTALLTQSGGDNLVVLNSGLLTIGTTYWINESDGVDFTNVGSPNNDNNTYFVATGTTPNSWGPNEGNPAYDILLTNTGAPVVTVLENTIGNVWFTYSDIGIYNINSDGLFTLNKTYSNIQVNGDDASSQSYVRTFSNINISIATITSGDISGITLDDQLFNTPIEIRVYN